MEFIWIDWNIAKIDNHHLSTDEVEFAWYNGRDVKRGHHPVNGPFWERLGECPSGRIIRIIWRYNNLGDRQAVYVITAY